MTRSEAIAALPDGSRAVQVTHTRSTYTWSSDIYVAPNGSYWRVQWNPAKREWHTSELWDSEVPDDVRGRDPDAPLIRYSD